jgi:hypothetical protein
VKRDGVTVAETAGGDLRQGFNARVWDGWRQHGAVPQLASRKVVWRGPDGSLWGVQAPFAPDVWEVEG